MALELRKAERGQSKLRVGFSAPSGGGKTYSALLLASGVASSWDKIAMIDTESGRGDLYSELGEYNIIRLEAPFSPERYIEAIKACEDAGMEVIIVDSISHEWEGKGGCLEINESLAQAKYRGNTWSAWNETTPRHQKFLESIITSSCHIITCVRNKVDTVMTEDKKVKKVGTKEITREGFEYELLVNFNIDRDTHKVTASKDNTLLFDKVDPFIVTAETGKKLMEWVMSGAKTALVVKKKAAPVSEPDDTGPVAQTVTKNDIVAYLNHVAPEVTKGQMAAYIMEKTGLDAKIVEPSVILKALKK